MSSSVFCLLLLMVLTHSYNDLCIRNSGIDELDQRYIFDLNSEQPYGEFNLVWKGVTLTQFWFWLSFYNNSYEWTIDDDQDQVLRYCKLPKKQQEAIKNTGAISYIYPFSCNNWMEHDPISKKSTALPHMEVFDCDVYSMDDILSQIVVSTGKSVYINDEGKIVIDDSGDIGGTRNEAQGDGIGWDLRYTDLVYIFILMVMGYYLFKKEQQRKRTRLYRPVMTDNDEM